MGSASWPSSSLADGYSSHLDRLKRKFGLASPGGLCMSGGAPWPPEAFQNPAGPAAQAYAFVQWAKGTALAFCSW